MNFEWDPEKNEKIKKERGISFEEIVFHLGHGSLWKIENHHNQQGYPDQEIFFIPIGDYVYLVPFVRKGSTFFLKSAFPSRKATREYRKENE